MVCLLFFPWIPGATPILLRSFVAVWNLQADSTVKEPWATADGYGLSRGPKGNLPLQASSNLEISRDTVNTFRHQLADLIKVIFVVHPAAQQTPHVVLYIVHNAPIIGRGLKRPKDA